MCREISPPSSFTTTNSTTNNTHDRRHEQQQPALRRHNLHTHQPPDPQQRAAVTSARPPQHAVPCVSGRTEVENTAMRIAVTTTCLLALGRGPCAECQQLWAPARPSVNGEAASGPSSDAEPSLWPIPGVSPLEVGFCILVIGFCVWACINPHHAVAVSMQTADGLPTTTADKVSTLTVDIEQQCTALSAVHPCAVPKPTSEGGDGKGRGG